MAHSFRSYYLHVIWSTKNRADLISKEIQPRLYAYMGGIVKNHQGSLLKIGGTQNHVHLLILTSTLDKFTHLIRDVKAKSSAWVESHYPHYHKFAWQEGYGAFSVSYSAHDKVIAYIENQEEHHKIMTFEEEFKNLIEKHNIQYDERFLLG